MSLVIVVQEKNLKNVVELYKIIAKNNVSIRIARIAITIFFLELNIS